MFRVVPGEGAVRVQAVSLKCLLQAANCEMQKWYSNTYQIHVSPQNVKWILVQSEGEIVFDHARDLGFHSSALLNGPGALGASEELSAECS